MGTDDGDIDDDGLKSLRAVWLSMPDEDPPERGLADLMAAARVKANEMAEAQQPSLWERFLCMMRRPQVLALATIMILIGGAVFITQRRDKLQASDPAVAETTTAPPAAPADKLSEPVGEASPVTATPPAADPGADDFKAAAPERAKVEKPSDTKVDTKAVSQRKAGAVSKKSKAKLESDLDSPFGLDEGVSSGKTAGGSPSGGGGGGVGTSTVGGANAGPKPDPKVDATVSEEEEQKEAPTVKQLHEQARAAAAKGDCTAVRTLAKQIARRDAPYYRANIAPDQALASCLN